MIVIPMAGLSFRFFRAGYTLPKYSEIGSKEADLNAGISAVKSKEAVLSGIMQVLFKSHFS